MVKNCAKLLPLVLLFAAFGSNAMEQDTKKKAEKGWIATAKANPKTTVGLTLAAAGGTYYFRKPIASGLGTAARGVGSGAGLLWDKAKANKKTALAIGVVGTGATLYGLNATFRLTDQFAAWRAKSVKPVVDPKKGMETGLDDAENEQRDGLSEESGPPAPSAFSE